MLAQAANAAAPYSYAVGDKISSDGVEYTIKSENLLTNGNFADGLEGWYNGTWQPTSTDFWAINNEGGPDNGTYIKSINGCGGGSGTTAALKRTFEMTPGKSYYFFTYVKGNKSNNSVRLGTGPTEKNVPSSQDHVVDFFGDTE